MQKSTSYGALFFGDTFVDPKLPGLEGDIVWIKTSVQQNGADKYNASEVGGIRHRFFAEGEPVYKCRVSRG